MDRDKAKAFISGLFNAYNNQDWETLFSKYLWEDCLFVTGNGSIQGKERILKSWEESVLATRKEILLEPTNILVDENQIAAEVPLKVIFKQDSVFGGTSFKKGQEIYAKCGDFYKLKDGKVYSITVYRLTPWGFQIWADNWNGYEKLVM